MAINYISNSKFKKSQNLMLSYKLGIVLSHVAIFIFTTALGRFTAKKSEENISSKVDTVYPGIPYRINYMIDVDTYFVPIFIHTCTCVVSHMVLVVIFDTLYLTLVEHCCGLFAALR